ncbi:MAG: amino terminal protease self-immunity, partial [Mucilaginibacter sp.]|nr:amino terminal protease self-immunity [Mucilaginibacter sp.]
IAGIAIALLFYPIMGTLVLSKSMNPLWRIFLSRIIIWGTLPLLYKYALKVEGRPFFLWPEKKQNIFFYVVAIVALFALIYVAHVISSIPTRLGFHDNYTMLKYWKSILKQNKAMLVFVGITAGITEELLLRAYVLPRLSLLFKTGYWPVIISSLLFSLLHLSYGSLTECIFTFLFGAVSALCYQKYQNIKVLMVFHAAYDLLVMF